MTAQPVFHCRSFAELRETFARFYLDQARALATSRLARLDQDGLDIDDVCALVDAERSTIPDRVAAALAACRALMRAESLH